jgi:hypothetical protein
VNRLDEALRGYFAFWACNDVTPQRTGVPVAILSILARPLMTKRQFRRWRGRLKAAIRNERNSRRAA